MADPINVLWQPAGFNLPQLGARSLTDVSDGDTPNIRMPIRMLSIDTPEVTARSEKGASKIDDKFAELATWMKEGKAPVTKQFQNYLLKKIDKKKPGTLQLEQGQEASSLFKEKVAERLDRGSKPRRKLFIRTADEQFDGYGRVLAYVSPSYSRSELSSMSRRERSTFNLDLVASGHAAPFIIYPSIPGELDLPIFVEAAASAQKKKLGQYSTPNSLPGYEYRMLEKLYSVTKRIVRGENVGSRDRYGWRTRYCADMRTRLLYGPEAYTEIPHPYRIWIWPDDVREAMGMLNLSPSPQLTS